MLDQENPRDSIVTAIRPEKKTLLSRAAVFAGDRPAVYVLLEDAARLTVGEPIAKDQLEAMRHRYQNRGAYLEAVRFLGPRDRSAQEVEQHIARKGWEPAACARALAKLRQEGTLDDHTFAVNWVAYRSRTSPRSRLAVIQELIRKGVARQTVLAAVEDMDEESLALACLLKKRRQWRRYEGDERRRRILAFLQRKGFPFDVCRNTAEAAMAHAPDD